MSRLPPVIKIWFALDLILCLFPPIHWALNDAAPIFGLPATLAYVIGMSAFVGLSLVAAYLAERRAGAAR